MPPSRVHCPFPNCDRIFNNARGLNAHAGRKHKRYSPEPIPYNDDFLDIEQYHYDGNDDLNPSIVEECREEMNQTEISLSNRYAPFTHEQWWILNWMNESLVSQTKQTKFYKVNHTFESEYTLIYHHPYKMDL